MTAAGPDRLGGRSGGGGAVDTAPAGLAPGLVLGPRAMERPRDAGWAATGTLMGEARARVDQAGLVSPEGAGWSLDWWIGADDRWYLPAREATVRQQRLGAGPVIETAVRIPGGDARHRVYGALAGTLPVTVVEVENDSAVPVALALALRPYGVGVLAAEAGVAAAPAGFDGPLSLDGWPAPAGAAHHEPVAVRAGGAVLAVLPRPPAHAGAGVGGDLLVAVEAGDDLRWIDGVAGAGANAVLLFPLPHRTTLRLLIPALAADATARSERRRDKRRGVAFVDKVRGRGAVSRAAVNADGAVPGPIPDPRSAPGADDVARGWASILAAGARVAVPDPGLGDLADGARGRLLLAAPDLGRRLRSLAPGAGAELAALALAGHHRDVDAAVAHLLDDIPAARRLRQHEDGADVLAALGLARSLAGGPADPDGPRSPADPGTATGGVRDPASPLVDPNRLSRLVEWALAVLALVERGGDSRSTVRARAGVALLAHPIDAEGAARLATDGGADPLGVAHRLVVGPAATVDRVNELAAEASPAGAWGGVAGDDPAGAARFVAALRSLLVDDSGPGLDLLPGFPPGWRGGALEVHGLPTRHGPVSFAIRWHGYRPALLWEVTPTGGDGPVIVRAPVLGAGWSTAEPRGETLLTGTGDELPAAPAPGEGFQ